MEKVFVDTSGWVAYFVVNDEFHNQAAKIFTQLKNRYFTIYTSDYIIDETITTIMVRGGYRQSVIAGTALLESKIIRIVTVAPEYFYPAWKLYQKYEDKIFSFTDVTSFVIMQSLKINKVFSFDKGFIQMGFDNIFNR